MSNNKSKNNKKRTRRQRRPQGYVPPRLADMKREFETTGVRITNMPQAVDYLELIDHVEELPGTPMLERPIFRFTEAAFDEAVADLESAIQTGSLPFTTSDLPMSEGVVLWDIADRDSWCGFGWTVKAVNILQIDMLTTRHRTGRNVFGDLSGLLPSTVPAVLTTDTIHWYGDRRTGQTVPSWNASAPTALVLLLRLILGTERSTASTTGEVRGHSANVSRPIRFYDVRSTPEEGAARLAGNGTGGHAGWHLQFKSHTRGYFRKNGTWVEPFTRGKHLPERPRVITGTTIRAGVAA